jgi:hypothetical protein
MDAGADLSVDGWHPDGQRKDGTRHRPGTCREHPPPISPSCAVSGRGHAGGRKHAQHRGGHRRNGGSSAPGRGRKDARVGDPVRSLVPGPAGVPELPGLYPLPEVADARTACLRGGCVHHRGAVAGRRAGTPVAEAGARCEFTDRDRRRVGYDDQPLPVLLAGRRRKSRNSMPIRRPRHSSSTPPARAGTCAGSRSTLTSAWGSPTSSRCSY